MIGSSQTARWKMERSMSKDSRYARNTESGYKSCTLCKINMLFQMNKAGVLRKAIEVIQKLQSDNARLKQENIALRMEQQKRGTCT